MDFVNIGILAHVDAGKTSLTERLLYHAGVLDRVGSVDAGNTQTDSLELERQRGITIRSAVVGFTVGETAVNLIDTPGHSDFIAEVERSVGVLDGAVLVVSAVEGVQAQTRVLMRTLRRLRIPTIVFVNKIDRTGARPLKLVPELRRRLSIRTVALNRPREAGSRAAYVEERLLDDGDAETLADGSDAFMRAYLAAEEELDQETLRAELRRQVRRAEVAPAVFGSALAGVGVEAVAEAVVDLFPSTTATGDGDLRARVFKIDRDTAGRARAYARVFSGRVAARENVAVHRLEAGGELAAPSVKPTDVGAFEGGPVLVRGLALGGQIATLWGIPEIRIGDQLGSPEGLAVGAVFARPSIETVVTARPRGDGSRLYDALCALQRQDPLIDVHREEESHELSVRLYGEVQKEVVEDTLARDFGVRAEFSESRVIHLERPIGVGEAVERMSEQHPVYFAATLGMRVEPGAPGSGLVFRRTVELGSLLPAFNQAVEETTRATLGQGLFGWEVADVVVTLIDSGYDSATSTGADFRQLTPLVLMAALRSAGTQVCEPVGSFELDTPADQLSSVVAFLTSARASIAETQPADETFLVRGTIPAAEVRRVELALAGLTHGEGTFSAEPAGHRTVTGAPPRRTRTDANPLDRDEYLLRVLKRRS